MSKLAGLSAANDDQPKPRPVIHSFFCRCHDCGDLGTATARRTDLFWALMAALLGALTVIAVLAARGIAQGLA